MRLGKAAGGLRPLETCLGSLLLLSGRSLPSLRLDTMGTTPGLLLLQATWAKGS